MVFGKLLCLIDELRMILDESRAQIAGAEVSVVQDGAVIRNRRRRPDQDKLAESAVGAGDGLGSIAPMDDELGHQGVVVGRHVRAGAEA